MGLYIGTGDQDNYAKVVLTANGGSTGVQFVEEVGGTPTAEPVAPLALPGPDAVDLYLTVDPAAATVVVSYRVTTNAEAGPLIALGEYAIPAAWFASTTRGLAIGIIATSSGGPTFPATWSVLEATSGAPPLDQPWAERPTHAFHPSGRQLAFWECLVRAGSVDGRERRDPYHRGRLTGGRDR